METARGNRAPGFIVLTCLLACAGLIVALTANGALNSDARVGPFSRLQLSMAIPIAAFWLGYLILPTFRIWMSQLDPVILVALQLMRVLGVAHLVSWGYGLMAGGFALPVVIGNAIVTVLAFPTLYHTARRDKNWRTWALVLSVVGLAEFVMTFALAVMGFLTVATPLDPPIATSGYASVVHLPLGIYPSYLIPLFTGIHFVTLVRVAHRPD